VASILKIGNRWRAQIRQPGRKSISKTFPTKAAAARWVLEIEGGNDHGNARIADLILAYREARAASGRPINPKSNEHYILAHLADGLGHHSAAELDTAKLLAWAQGRRREGTGRKRGGSGPVALNMEVSKLGTVLKHTASLLRLRLPDIVGEARPTLQHYGLIAEAKKRTRRPQADELARIYRWFRDHPEYDIPMQDIIEVARQSILRRGEVSRIEWRDLDPARRGVVVRDRKHPRKKEGNDEFVLLPAEAWEIIQRQPRRDGEPRIFPFKPGTVSKYFKWACDACGIENLHLHDLKREATSSLAELGLTPQEITAAGGPRKWEVQERYTNIDPIKLHERLEQAKKAKGI